MPPVPSSDEYDNDTFEYNEEVFASARAMEDRFNLTLSQLPLHSQQRLPSQPPSQPPPTLPHTGRTYPPQQPYNAPSTSHSHMPGQRPISRPTSIRPPPPKKFKPNAYRTLNEDDELPEISVDSSGRYTVTGSIKVGQNSNGPAGSQAPTQTYARPPQAGNGRLPNGSEYSHQAGRQLNARPPFRPPIGRSNSSTLGQNIQHPSPLAQAAILPPVQEGRTSSVRPTTPVDVGRAGEGRRGSSSQTAVSPVGVASRAGTDGAEEGQPPPKWAEELQALKAQLVELRRRNETLLAEKTKAQELGYANMGEVSNVRRLMEQQTRANLEAMNKLKEEKEALSKAIEGREQEMKRTIDGLQSQIKFQQHEFHTTAKKPAWNRPPQSQLHPNSLYPGQTPSRTPARQVPRSRPPSSPVQPTLLSKKAVFTGFENSFAPTPKPALTRTRGQVNGTSPAKGKGKENTSGWGGASQEESFSPVGETLQAQDDQPVEESVPVDFGDIPMLDADNASVSKEEGKNDTEEDSFFGPPEDSINWREELHHAAFKHRSLLYSSDESNEPPPLTIQLLLTVKLCEDTPEHAVKQYSQVCADVFAGFGMDHSEGAVREDGASEELSTVGQGLSRLAALFCHLALIRPISLCFDLLAFISYQIPAFRQALLAVPSESPDSAPTLLVALRECVTLHMQPAKMREADVERRAVAETCLTLIETLAARVSEDDVPKLGIFPSSTSFVATLLDPTQPPWVVERSSRLMYLFSCHVPLCRSMLAFAEKAGTGVDRRTDYGSMPLIDMLCNFLLKPQPNATFEQAHGTMQASICAITSLSIAHPDTLQLLRECRCVIPSLVSCLRLQSMVLWDENESIIESPQRQTTLLHTLQLCLTLFHHIGLTDELQQKLQNSKVVNGVTHAFLLGIGRLSYADPPEWLDPENVKRVTDMRDQARDLFEQVIEDPLEGDSVWAAYQDDGEDSTSGTESEQEPDEPEQPDIPMDED